MWWPRYKQQILYFSMLGGHDIWQLATIIWELEKRRRLSKLHFSTRGCSFLAPMLPKKMCEEDAIKTWLKLASKRYKTKYSYISFILSSSSSRR
ncbi:unnamed protein product [Acanthoscelides obtectus]|uniref:Uncharacterized protein n=1 Tax=Acanthoscelides obtectus TaxID=200917 RepID=A0A9P0L8I6_ACAOB|nr:unnamed protein product [Acanthoscelides obtectus]CAK1651630.1 hypothetical protein AOBTE_LOCUS17365 [Acanthoscelides obtectus]